MKILSAGQIRLLDKYTIEHEPVLSINLMERAASRFTEAVALLADEDQKILVFCGTGNNGGDGLATGRFLLERGFNNLQVYVLGDAARGSTDFKDNEKRLAPLININYIIAETQIPPISGQDVCIDALFGTGLSRPVEGLSAKVIEAINKSGATVYSIDVPSGLYCDRVNDPHDPIIRSTTTFTFQAPKLSFMLAQNGPYVPDFRILDIGLMKEGEASMDTAFEYADEDWVKHLLYKRGKFSHKGTYGHALICAGSYGKMGAAVLSVSAALRSGAGLVSTYIPKCGYQIMQTANPEAMVYTDANEHYLSKPGDFGKFTSIGCGPGIGMEVQSFEFVEALLKHCDQPMVLDADALNIIAAYPHLKDLLAPNTILTPHPGEFKRLAGDWKDDGEKLNKQIAFSKQYQVVVALKGANTSISTPEGKVYFNSTGNPGMAKGGTGDVLTGILSALLAQHYSAKEAAILGVYIHGWAGDYAAAKLGQTAMKASDIIGHLPEAFLELEQFS